MHYSPTFEGGTTVFLKNSTPATLPSGYVVKADIANDDSVVLCAKSDVDPIGIVYEDIPPGQWGRIVINGIADVFLDNLGLVAREQWVGVSTATAGMCTASNIPVPPAQDAHFREVGHTIRQKLAGPPGKCRCIIHFL